MRDHWDLPVPALFFPTRLSSGVVGAGREDGVDFLAEAGESGGQDGRGDDGRLHGGSRAGFIGRAAPVGAALAAIGGLLASAQRLDAVVGGVDLACAGI